MSGAQPGLGAGRGHPGPDPRQRGEQPEDGDRPLPGLCHLNVVQHGVQDGAQQSHQGECSGNDLTIWSGLIEENISIF